MQCRYGGHVLRTVRGPVRKRQGGEASIALRFLPSWGTLPGGTLPVKYPVPWDMAEKIVAPLSHKPLVCGCLVFFSHVAHHATPSSLNVPRTRGDGATHAMLRPGFAYGASRSRHWAFTSF